MPYALLNIRGGCVTNLPNYALSDRSEAVINWMEDEAGTNVTRPGLVAFASPAPSTGQGQAAIVATGDVGPFSGMVAYRDFVVAVSSTRRVYRIASDGTATDITGQLRLGGEQPARFFEDSNGVLFITGGGSIQRYDGSGICTTVTNGPEATHLVEVNRYLVGNNTGLGTINYTSAIDHETWDLAGRIFTAESRNDPVTAILEVNQFLYLFGPESVDVYYPTRIDDPAFSRSHTVRQGLLAPGSAVRVDQTIYFLDDLQRIVRLDGNAREVRSISWEIEETLKSYPVVSDCSVYRVDIDGKHLLAWDFPTAGTTWVYDYALSQGGKNIWTEWRRRSSGRWTAMALRSHCFQPRWRKHLVSDATASTIYELTMDAGTDAGAEILRVRRSGFISHGASVRKQCHRLRLHLTRGTTAITGSAVGANPTIQLRWRDEDRVWMPYQQLSLGAQGNANQYGADLSPAGIYRERQWEWACSEAIPRLGVQAPEEFFDPLVR